MNLLASLRSGLTTDTAEETQAVAAALAELLPVDLTLALRGDVGAGKTTFVQGLARGSGIAEAITSPTFTVYTLHRGRRLLAHVDAYRLHSAADMDALLLEEFLDSPYCLAVEWPERIAAWLPGPLWEIDFGQDEGRRTLRLRGP